jgi:hypothetical protein
MVEDVKESWFFRASGIRLKSTRTTWTDAAKRRGKELFHNEHFDWQAADRSGKGFVARN